MGIRRVSGGLLVVLLGAVLGAGCLGADAAGSAQCEAFGGTCVASANLCGGSLPYGCVSGVCCESALPAPTDAALPPLRKVDATLPGFDATVAPEASASQDASTDSASSGDVTVSSDVTTTTPDTGSADVGVTSDSSSMDASTHDAGHEQDAHEDDAHKDDAKVGDAGTEDAKKDVAIKDAGGKSFEAGFICNHYASPNEPGTCPDTVGQCPGEATCQPNGCFNGDYCHLTTGHCVLKSSVSCDGGL